MAASLKLVEDKKVDADRQKALDAALAQIDRAFGKGSAMKLGQKEAMQVESISTGSLGLDIALGVGGLPKGRVVEVYGPESSGKTTLALHVIAEAQKAGGTADDSFASLLMRGDGFDSTRPGPAADPQPKVVGDPELRLLSRIEQLRGSVATSSPSPRGGSSE